MTIKEPVTVTIPITGLSEPLTEKVTFRLSYY